MKRQIGVGMLLTVGLLISGARHPGQAWSDPPCSLRTLKGTYAYHCSGVHLGTGQPVSVAFAGQDQYHGDGTMTGVYSFSENGVISHNIAYTGTYTVNPDCTRHCHHEGCKWGRRARRSVLWTRRGGGAFHADR